MPINLAKPASPLWQPGRAPAGCRGYWLLAEGSGPVVRDLTGQAGGSFVGSPAWGRGPFGPQLGGLSTSSYATAGSVAATAYPFWHAALVVVGATQTTFATVFGEFDPAAAANNASVFLRRGSSASTWEYSVRGGTPAPAATTLTAGAGAVLLLLGASYSVTDHRVWAATAAGWASGSTATSSTSRPAATLTRFGVQNFGSAVSNAWDGSLVACASGTAAVPDFSALAADWLSGTFAAARPRRRAWLFAGLPAGGYKVWYAGSGRGSALGSGAI